MIKTPLSTVIGGAFWTPGATIIGSASKTLDQLIKSLFSNNEVGFAYDPNDLTTLYQDAAGTIPVTTQGQAVGLILDKSGRDNHAFQNDSGKRPLLQRNATTGAYYLAFDGVDDFLQTNYIDFTSTDKVSLFVGVRKLSDAATGLMCELGIDAQMSFRAYAPALGGVQKYAAEIGLGDIRASTPDALYSSPNNVVFTAKYDRALNLSLKLNTLTFMGVRTHPSTGNYGNYPLYIGRRDGTSLPFNGHIYGLIGIGKLTSDAETVAIEKELAKRVGVTLNV